MAITRAQLRTAIRAKLKNWAVSRTTLAGAINSSVTALSLASGTEMKARSLIQIGNEIIRVHTASGATASEIMRGEFDSVAAAHANLAVAQVFPLWGWTDLEINNAIENSLVWLGEGMVYTLVPKTNTLLAGFKDYGLPAGCNYPNGNIVKRVEIRDTDGLYWPVLGWKHLGDRLIFNSTILSDTVAKLWIQTLQPTMAAGDGAELDDAKALEPLQLYTAGRLMEEFVANRALFYEYSATLNDRASTLDELSRSAYFMQNQAVILRDALSRPGIPGFASRQKDG